MSWLNFLVEILVLFLVVLVISLLFREKLKKVIKIEIIAVSFISVLIVVGIISIIFMKDENEYSNLENIKFNINENDVIHVNNNKLFNQNNKEITAISDNEKIGSYYLPIECYNHDKFLFIVYSHSQNELNNSLFIKESYEKDSLLYIVFKDTGCGELFTRQPYVYNYRYKLDTINFIDNQTFVMEMYDLFDPVFVQIGIFEIFRYKDDIRITEDWIIDIRKNIKIDKYVLTKEYFVISGKIDDEKIIDIRKYNYDTYFTVNGKYIDSFSSSFNYLDDYTEKYKNELYLYEGYYKVIDDNIYYLDNNLVIRELVSNNYYQELTNLNQWIK